MNVIERESRTESSEYPSPNLYSINCANQPEILPDFRQQSSLLEFFIYIKNKFYTETFLWIVATITHHHLYDEMRTLLGMMAQGLNEPRQSVLKTMALGFLEGAAARHTTQFEGIGRVLEDLDRTGHITWNQSSILRVQGLMLSMSLSPTVLLSRFTEVVRSAARTLIRQRLTPSTNVFMTG